MDRLLKITEGLRIKAEFGHIQLKVRLVQETHDDLFPKERRQHGNSNIQLLSGAHLQLDSPILSQSPLGDIEVSHHFQTREQRVLKFLRGVHNLVQYPIDAEPYPKHLFVRLDMNIAGSASRCIRQNGIDQRNHRSFIRSLLEVLKIDFLPFVDHLHLAIAELLEDLVITDPAKALVQDSLNSRS